MNRRVRPVTTGGRRYPAAVPLPTARRLLAAVAAALLLAASCSDDAPDRLSSSAADDASGTTEPPTTSTTIDPRHWPADDWPRVDPSEVGIEQADLDALFADAEAGESTCVAVTADGALVADAYWHGADASTEAEAWSVTKSITATLVGIAQDEGHLDIDQPASDFLDEWIGTPSESITIRNLLANDSGRFHDMATDYGQMALTAEDKTAFSIGLDQQHDPGTVWVYNNSAIQTLEAVLERATGEPVDEYARTRLFEPLGMASDMTADPAGNTLVFMGAQATCLDLARFGLLYLRGGEWEGEQVVSAEFVAEATRPSQELNQAYGLLWWLLGDADADTAVGQGGLVAEGAPGFAALGLGDQVVAVFPGSGLVVTRMGDDGGFGVGQISTWAAGLGLPTAERP